MVLQASLANPAGPHSSSVLLTMRCLQAGLAGGPAAVTARSYPGVSVVRAMSHGAGQPKREEVDVPREPTAGVAELTQQAAAPASQAGVQPTAGTAAGSEVGDDRDRRQSSPQSTDQRASGALASPASPKRALQPHSTAAGAVPVRVKEEPDSALPGVDAAETLATREVGAAPGSVAATAEGDSAAVTFGDSLAGVLAKPSGAAIARAPREEDMEEEQPSHLLSRDRPTDAADARLRLHRSMLDAAADGLLAEALSQRMRANPLLAGLLAPQLQGLTPQLLAALQPAQLGGAGLQPALQSLLSSGAGGALYDTPRFSAADLLHGADLTGLCPDTRPALAASALRAGGSSALGLAALDSDLAGGQLHRRRPVWEEGTHADELAAAGAQGPAGPPSAKRARRDDEAHEGFVAMRPLSGRPAGGTAGLAGAGGAGSLAQHAAFAEAGPAGPAGGEMDAALGPSQQFRWLDPKPQVRGAASVLLRLLPAPCSRSPASASCFRSDAVMVVTPECACHWLTALVDRCA
jgi:hypothetical protein